VLGKPPAIVLKPSVTPNNSAVKTFGSGFSNPKSKVSNSGSGFSNSESKVSNYESGFSNPKPKVSNPDLKISTFRAFVSTHRGESYCKKH
jgi:hypothetical protein